MPYEVDELPQRPNLFLKFWGIRFDVRLRHNKAHISGAHFLKLMRRITLLQRHQKVRPSPHSVRLSYNLSPAIFAGCFGGKNNDIIHGVRRIVICVSRRKDKIRLFVTFGYNLLLKAKMIV